MTLAAVRAAIDRIPIWKDATELDVSLLRGGITNRNYRIDVGDKSYVLRVSGDRTELLGIHRDFEYRTQQIAGELGIAPEVVYFLEPEGYLVTRFVEGRAISPEELRKPENIVRVADTLHNIHAMPTIPGTFSAFQVVRDYYEVARRHNVQLPENLRWLMHQTKDAEAALKNRTIVARPCHNDLLNGNLLLGDRLYILDWEYAGMGDVFFDLANFSNNHELTEHEDRLLVDCYFGQVKTRDLIHLHIMKMMSDFREAMWGLVQSGISSLDFDFCAYAAKHFDRLSQNILDPNWERWLKELR